LKRSGSRDIAAPSRVAQALPSKHSLVRRGVPPAHVGLLKTTEKHAYPQNIEINIQKYSKSGM